MIHVIATLELEEGKVNDYLRELNKIIADVRAEAGCIDYGPTMDLATDIPVQEPVRQNVVTIVERWADVAALQAHLKAKHMQTYRAATKNFVKGLSIRILRPA
jgi:quinol monooxygenase YgiN